MNKSRKTIITRLPSFTRPNGAYFRGLPRLAKNQPRRDNFPTGNVPSWNRRFGRLGVMDA